MICHILLISLVSVTGGIEILPNAANDSTPFVVKVKASELPPDTEYEFCLWVFDKDQNSAISQIWESEEMEWKYGWTGYQPFSQDTASTRIGWAFLRIHKEPLSNNYYIKYKIRNGKEEWDTQIDYPDFKILDMTTEGGWLVGTIFSNPNLDSPLENSVVLAKSDSEVVGTYITEDNQINESYPLNLGQFRVAVPTGTISSLSFTSREGESITGYTETSAPWTISAGKITYIDSFTIKQTLSLDISPNPFSPNEPENKVTYISYKLPYNEAYIKIYIYDRRGRRVRKLMDGDLSGSSLRTIWNGKNDKGNILPMGIYIVYLQAEDKSSNKVETKKAEVVIAKRL